MILLEGARRARVLKTVVSGLPLGACDRFPLPYSDSTQEDIFDSVSFSKKKREHSSTHIHPSIHPLNHSFTFDWFIDTAENGPFEVASIEGPVSGFLQAGGRSSFENPFLFMSTKDFQVM